MKRHKAVTARRMYGLERDMISDSDLTQQIGSVSALFSLLPAERLLKIEVRCVLETQMRNGVAVRTYGNTAVSAHQMVLRSKRHGDPGRCNTLSIIVAVIQEVISM